MGWCRVFWVRRGVEVKDLLVGDGRLGWVVEVVQPELQLEEVVVHRCWVVWGLMGLVSFQTS